MAEQKAADAKKSGLWEQILPAVAVALLVGGTSPWWFKALRGEDKVQQATAPAQAAPSAAPPMEVTASRDFGEWRTQVMNGPQSHANTMDYSKNGRFDGNYFDSSTAGQTVHVAGSWQFESLSSKVFRLHLLMDPGVHSSLHRWVVTYKILDKDHLQRTDQGNFVVERVE